MRGRGEGEEWAPPAARHGRCPPSGRPAARGTPAWGASSLSLPVSLFSLQFGGRAGAAPGPRGHVGPCKGDAGRGAPPPAARLGMRARARSGGGGARPMCAGAGGPWRTRKKTRKGRMREREPRRPRRAPPQFEYRRRAAGRRRGAAPGRAARRGRGGAGFWPAGVRGGDGRGQKRGCLRGCRGPWGTRGTPPRGGALAGRAAARGGAVGGRAVRRGPASLGHVHARGYTRGCRRCSLFPERLHKQQPRLAVRASAAGTDGGVRPRRRVAGRRAAKLPGHKGVAGSPLGGMACGRAAGHPAARGLPGGGRAARRGARWRGAAACLGGRFGGCWEPGGGHRTRASCFGKVGPTGG
jgi:hypothetical protein